MFIILFISHYYTYSYFVSIFYFLFSMVIIHTLWYLYCFIFLTLFLHNFFHFILIYTIDVVDLMIFFCTFLHILKILLTITKKTFKWRSFNFCRVTIVTYGSWFNYQKSFPFINSCSYSFTLIGHTYSTRLKILYWDFFKFSAGICISAYMVNEKERDWQMEKHTCFSFCLSLFKGQR